ncbi:uncharacterized protein LOC131950165 isoform X2 [Physella acuta]|nr:uncharacterized protein LOC131950165 isoform X2 [Physella acuta]
MDCSPLIKKQTLLNMSLPLTIGQDISLSDYIDLMYSMSTVEIEWSNVFTLKGETPFLLLFTGTRNGNVNAWKVNIPFETKEDFIHLYTDKYHSEVSSVKWLPQNLYMGLLSVGYADGSVRVLEVFVDSEDSIGLAMREIFSDLLADKLAISDMGWAHPNRETSVLVVCKQYFLFVYGLKDYSMFFANNYLVDSGMPLSSISMCGAHGVASSHDGLNYNFEIKIESGQISLDLSKMNISCLLHGFEIQWLCMGTAVSPSSGICLTAHKINYSAKVLDLNKKYLNRQKVIMTSLLKMTKEAVKEILVTTGVFLSPQHTMIYLRLYIQQIFKNDEDLKDVLDIYYLLDSYNTIKSLQIMRDMLLFMKHWTTIKIQYERELEWVSSSYEETTERLLVLHVESCLSQLPSAPDLQEIQVVKAMLTWIMDQDTRLTRAKERLDLDWLKSACQDSDFPKCAICFSEFQLIGQLMVQCTRGHTMHLCSLSLLPCQDPSVRTCESCGHPAVSPELLSNVSMVKLQFMCVLCGGFLRHAS